jgi:hypothetical protein
MAEIPVGSRYVLLLRARRQKNDLLTFVLDRLLGFREEIALLFNDLAGFISPKDQDCTNF